MQINTIRDAANIAGEYLWYVPKNQYSEKLKNALANMREAIATAKELNHMHLDFSLVNDALVRKITSNLEVISDECTKISNQVHKTAG